MYTFFEHPHWLSRGICAFSTMMLVLGMASGVQAEAAHSEVLAAQASDTHLTTNILLAPASPNIIPDNTQINISFRYQTNQAGGVRIYAHPFTNGKLTPNYASSGSPLYAAGSGSGTASFTIDSGSVVVDQIRFEILDASSSLVLFETFIPVYYLFSSAPTLISNITLSPGNPNCLAFNANTSLTFNYRTNQADGVYIFARPYTNGAMTPNYSAPASSLSPVGTGSGSGSFTITSGAVIVDHIYVWITPKAQSTVLFEALLPVSYAYRNPANLINNLILTPASPNILAHNQNLNVAFHYQTNHAGGVKIFARPFIQGLLATNYSASGSPIYAALSGNGSGLLTINSGPAIVDQIRLQMWDVNQTTLLYEDFIPVSYQFGGVRLAFMPAILK